MHRRLYGHDYKSPSNALRNLLIGIAAVIILVAFVWTTYDPETFRLLSGIRPAPRNMQRAVEQQRIDAMPQRDLRDKSRDASGKESQRQTRSIVAGPISRSQ